LLHHSQKVGSRAARFLRNRLCLLTLRGATIYLRLAHTDKLFLALCVSKTFWIYLCTFMSFSLKKQDGQAFPSINIA